MTPEDVATRADFAQFLDELHADYRKYGQTWENPTLERFLGALARYAIDIPAYYTNTRQRVDPDTASWRVLADMLWAARIYE